MPPKAYATVSRPDGRSAAAGERRRRISKAEQIALADNGGDGLRNRSRGVSIQIEILRAGGGRAGISGAGLVADDINAVGGHLPPRAGNLAHGIIREILPARPKPNLRRLKAPVHQQIPRQQPTTFQ